MIRDVDRITHLLTAIADADAYRALFHAVDNGDGTASIVLTDAATNTITQTVEAETKKIPVSKIAAGTATEIAVTGATPGIWYQLNAAATLEGMTYVDEVQWPLLPVFSVACFSPFWTTATTWRSFSFENGLQGATGDTARFFKISASATKRYTNKGE